MNKYYDQDRGVTLEDLHGEVFEHEVEEEACIKEDGCNGFNRHDWDCPKYRDYSNASGDVF